MSLAESLDRHIKRQDTELRSLLDALASTRHTTSGAWSAREILLHLLGVARDIPDQVLRSAEAEGATATPSQPGGEYTEVPGLPTAHHVATALLDILNVIRERLRGVGDDALQRTVTLTISERESLHVPFGLVLRHTFTTHFDEHMAQLQDALARGVS